MSLGLSKRIDFIARQVTGKTKFDLDQLAAIVDDESSKIYKSQKLKYQNTHSFTTK